MNSHIGRTRVLTHPETGQKVAASVIRDEIYVPAADQPDYDGGAWGGYRFGAWLEEDADQPGAYIISFPYWRNGNFAGQYTLRAEPYVIRELFQAMQARGWLERPGWANIPADRGNSATTG